MLKHLRSNFVNWLIDNAQSATAPCFFGAKAPRALHERSAPLVQRTLASHWGPKSLGRLIYSLLCNQGMQTHCGVLSLDEFFRITGENPQFIHVYSTSQAWKTSAPQALVWSTGQCWMSWKNPSSQKYQKWMQQSTVAFWLGIESSEGNKWSRGCWSSKKSGSQSASVSCPLDALWSIVRITLATLAGAWDNQGRLHRRRGAVQYKHFTMVTMVIQTFCQILILLVVRFFAASWWSLMVPFWWRNSSDTWSNEVSAKGLGGQRGTDRSEHGQPKCSS